MSDREAIESQGETLDGEIVPSDVQPRGLDRKRIQRNRSRDCSRASQQATAAEARLQLLTMVRIHLP